MGSFRLLPQPRVRAQSSATVDSNESSSGVLDQAGKLPLPPRTRTRPRQRRPFDPRGWVIEASGVADCTLPRPPRVRTPLR